MFLKKLEEDRCHSDLKAEGSGELQSGQFHPSPWQSDGAINSGRHMKEKKVISHHGIIRCNYVLSNLRAFYYDVTCLRLQRRAAHVAYLEFSKAVDTVSKTSC